MVFSNFIFGMDMKGKIKVFGLLILIISFIWNIYNKRPALPLIVWWTKTYAHADVIKNCGQFQCILTSRRVFDKFCSANVNKAYIFYGSDFKVDDLPLPRQANKILWGLFHEESPRNFPLFSHDSFLQLFNYSATFSRYSNVPMTLQYLKSFDDITTTEYYLDTDAKNSITNISPILYLQSDCATTIDRDDYVRELMKYISVDSYGTCLNNKVLPDEFKHDYYNNLNNDSFLKFVARYKFTLAIENGICNDYITEKLWRPIKVGSVPIYYGSPKVRDYLPNEKSAILIEDFLNPQQLATYLHNLLINNDHYEKYLEHKIKGTVRNTLLADTLKRKQYDMHEMEDKFECFLCEKLHSKTKSIAIVNISHYECLKPINLFNKVENPKNTWLYLWYYYKDKVEKCFQSIILNDNPKKYCS